MILAMNVRSSLLNYDNNAINIPILLKKKKTFEPRKAAFTCFRVTKIRTKPQRGRRQPSRSDKTLQEHK